MVSKAQVTRQVQADQAELRPSERVMEYLLAEFDRPERKQGSRLPTMRQLAARLDVSQPTVHGVLQKLVKQGRIRTVAGSGTYLVPPRQKSPETLRIAVNVTVPEGETGRFWIHRIAAAITLAVCKSERRIHVAPLPRHVTGEDAEVRKLLEERAHVDALMLFQLENASVVRDAYEAEGKPVVDINPPSDTATANFVSTDFFGSSFRLGTTWTTTGRKRILCLTSNYEGGASEHLRNAGLAAGLGTEIGRSITLRVVDVHSSSEEIAYQAIRPLFADRSTAPDAVYCCGDYQAMGVLRACREYGLRVPEDVSVVGGTGLDLSESTCPQLTRVKQPFERIGEELLSLLCDRIEGKNLSLPARIVPTGFMGGATTRPDENESLGIGGTR